MVHSSIKFKVFILPLSLAIAVLIVVLVVKPSFDNLGIARQNLAEKQDQLEKLKQQNQKLQQLKTSWDAMAEEKNLVNAAVPADKNVDAYISELTAKAARSGVLLSDIKMSQTSASSTPAYVCGAGSVGATTGDGSSSSAASSSYQPGATSSASGTLLPASAGGNCLTAIPVSLSFKGSWEQFLDFSKYLQEMSRLSNVTEISIAPDIQGSDLLSVNLTAGIFHKTKESAGNQTAASLLASQAGFNKTAIENLKQIVYAPYEVPVVSPLGERNLFK